MRHKSAKWYGNLADGGRISGNNISEIRENKRKIKKTNGYGLNQNRGMAGLATNRLIADARPGTRTKILQEHFDALKMDKYGRCLNPKVYEQVPELGYLNYKNNDPRIDLNLDNNREPLATKIGQSNFDDIDTIQNSLKQRILSSSKQ